MKRVFDVTVSLVVLVGLAPLWLAVCLLIKLSSKGSILYRASGVGREEKPLTYYKFRTMVDGNDDSNHRAWVASYVSTDQPYTTLTHQNGKATPVYKVLYDERVTTIGQYLRRFSLDEVPQFINVLRGEMSVVGPRVPLDYEHAHYDDVAKQRLLVLPGITGLAQVRARGTASFSEMLKLDLEYVEKRSIWLDLWIALQTFPVIIIGKGYTG